MLIGYGGPEYRVITWNSQPVGVQAINALALMDGRPSSVARLVWPLGVTAAGHYVAARIDWPEAIAVRVLALLGLQAPPGVRVEFLGRRVGDPGYAYALGGNADTRSQRLPDGTCAVWAIAAAGNSPLIGIEVRIYNDSDGDAWVSDGLTTDVGELVVMQAVEITIKPDWNVERIDPRLTSRTLGAQTNVVPRRTYRRLQAQFTPAALADARASALANGMDWETFQVAVGGDNRMAAIPRWRTTAGQVDVAELHRTAVYGLATTTGIGHLGGNYYDSSCTVEEVPPIEGTALTVPGAPVDLRINGEVAPAVVWGAGGVVVASWAHPNGRADREPDATYTVRWYADGVLNGVHSGLTAPEVAYRPPGAGGKQVRVEVVAVRSGVTSRPILTHTFLYRATLLTNSGAFLASDSGLKMIAE